MPKYLLAYQQPKGYVPGTDPSIMAEWEGFFEGIAASIVDPGHPVSGRTAVGEVGASTQLGGYSVIEAASLEDAAAMAKGCPSVQYGGGVQVAELAQLPPDHLAERIRAARAARA